LETALKTDLLYQALAHRQTGRLDELQRICHELLEVDSECADAWYLLGVAAWDRADGLHAQEYISRAIAFDGHNPQYRNAMGIVLIENQQYHQAEMVLGGALSKQPGNTDLLCNLGRALMLQGRQDEALSYFSKALSIHPTHATSLFNLSVIYQSRGQLSLALTNYHQALRSDPLQPKWWANLGATLLSLADYPAAATSFRQTLALAPDQPMAMRGLGVACCALGHYEEAGRLLSRSLSNSPEDAEAVAHLALVYQHTAQWHALGKVLPQLDQQTRTALAQGTLPAEQPLFNISRIADPALNLAVARAWSHSIAQRARRAGPPFRHDRRLKDGRITIGYLSADFRSHAVAHQAVALFELHDRRNYRVCGFSVGPNHDDDYRRRIATACDLFVDLSGADSLQAARAIHDSGVDILVDLMGHTHQNRLDICALRPAPLQISYLGFLTSSGADFIDYLIGDHIVTPPEHAQFYSEKIIRLPHCYQIISPTEPSNNAWTRHQAHLPKEAFVFCCFNQAYKIDPEVFAGWMEILRSVPSAVLWLYRTNDMAAANLKAEAERHGVDPERLVFAEKVPIADHLNRLRLADLALDTVLYNGGATTANALAAGVPLVTTLGKHFVSRMSASHLATLGLGSLVATDLQHYVRMAVSLARSPQQLQSIRHTLGAAKASSTLFDAPRFVRDLERAYGAIWSNYFDGKAPEHLDLFASNQTEGFSGGHGHFA
jgi:protein O-GlcNAc transferase